MRRLVPRLAPLLFLSIAAALATAAESAPPRLAVVISIDQFRADYLGRFAPFFTAGGFARLTAGGTVFTDCHFEHGVIKTAPGHAVMLTGVHANLHGIIANDWKLRQWPALEEVNAVEDRAAALVGAAPRVGRSPGGVLEAKAGRSPRHLLATTVGDQLKLRHGARAKVYGVADKDRAAILMAGRLADGAYWTERGRVITSTYYRAELPVWLTAFNAAQRAEQRFGQTWDRLLDPAAYDALQGPDDAPGEATDFGLPRTFPKRIDGGQPQLSPAFYDAFDQTPWNNKLVADLARELITRENLGADDGAPDLLAIGFSQLDRIGHGYGPDSHEVMDSLVRLDRTLAALFEFLDAQVGPGHHLVVLTADHGVAPLPERLQATQRDLATGRVLGSEVDRHVFAALEAQFGPLPDDLRWAVRDGGSYHLNPAALAARALAPATLAEALGAALRTHPAIAAAATRARLTDPAPLDAIGEALRLSFHAERSADVLYVLRPYFIDRANSGTTHGQPYDYDNHVPLVWLGAGAPAGVRPERVSVADLAPTLAALLGVPRPPQAGGRQLF